jgi:hypothetical protein
MSRKVSAVKTKTTTTKGKYCILFLPSNTGLLGTVVCN